MASIQGARPADVWCTNVFVACLHASVHVCVFMYAARHRELIQCETEVLAATAQADPSVVELSVCDFEAWLMDADLAPCSLSVPFSIYQPRDVSWFTTLSLFHFLLVKQSTRVHLGPLQAIVICLGAVDAKLRMEQHGGKNETSECSSLKDNRRGKCTTDSDPGLSLA